MSVWLHKTKINLVNIGLLLAAVQLMSCSILEISPSPPPSFGRPDSHSEALHQHRDFSEKKPGSRTIASAKYFTSDSLRLNNPDSRIKTEEDNFYSVTTTLEKKVEHLFDVSVGYGFSSLGSKVVGTGRLFKLQSAYDLGLGAGVSQKWNSRWSTFQRVGIRAVDFDHSGDSSIILRGNQNILPKLSIGFANTFSKLKTAVSVSYGPELFIGSLPINLVSIEKVNVASANLGIKYNFYEKDNAKLGLLAEAKYIHGASASSFSISSGFAYNAGFSLSKKYEKRDFQLDLGFSQRKQSTTQVENTESSLFGLFIFSHSWFHGGI